LSIIKTHNPKNYSIMHGIRELKDQIEEIDKHKYELYVSREEVLSAPNIFKGRVTNYVQKKIDEIDENYLFFLCGNSLMVSAIHELLIKNKINNNQIFTEIFF